MGIEVLRPVLAVFLWGLAALASAEPIWTWESEWSARELWSGAAATSGAGVWVSETGLPFSRMWAGLGAEFDLGVPWNGNFAVPQPQGLVRVGWSIPFGGTVEFIPWVGAAAGLNLGAVEAGLDTEARIWGGHFVVFGLEVRSDGSFGVTLAFRDRTAAPLPVWGTRPDGPPAVSMAVGPGPFDPEEGNPETWLRVRPRTDEPWRIQHWTWTVVAPESEVFYQRSGTGPLPADLVWDGFSASGELVSSATDYTLSLKTWDDFGQVSTAEVPIVTDILVIRVRNRLLIRLPAINFQADSPALVASQDQQQNFRIIQRLAEILRKFPRYAITIEGHANLIRWADPALGADEDLKESRPLSLRRAQAVKDALTSLGLDPGRIKTEGAGASDPLFPYGDRENSWKNRRVDIYLDKPVTGN